MFLEKRLLPPLDLRRALGQSRRTLQLALADLLYVDLCDITCKNTVTNRETWNSGNADVQHQAPSE